MHVKEGVGDLYGSLRPDVPRQRNYLTTAANPRVGESEYMRYDAATTRQAIDWLATDAQQHDARPGACGSPTPCRTHPFVASAEDIARYPLEDIQLPINFRSPDWPHHPHIDYIRERRIQSPDEQLDENARPAHHRYLPRHVHVPGSPDRSSSRGAEPSSGLGDSSTRVIYTSDHGEMLGDHGMWGKNLMYEGASAVPFLMAGPDIARGQVLCPSPFRWSTCFRPSSKACRRTRWPTAGRRPSRHLPVARRAGRPVARAHDLRRVPRLRLPRGHVHAA